MDGYYYLHTNGNLIFKKFEPELDSPFVQHVWPIDIKNRADAWKIILESISLGADLNRVKELAEKWGCTPQDLVEYMARVKPPGRQIDGLYGYLNKIMGVDADKWLDWLSATPEGQEPNWKSMPIKEAI